MTYVPPCANGEFATTPLSFPSAPAWTGGEDNTLLNEANIKVENNEKNEVVKVGIRPASFSEILDFAENDSFHTNSSVD